MQEKLILERYWCYEKNQVLNSKINIYEKLFGIKSGINLAGILTKLGGSTPSSKVVDAATEASKYFVDLSQLLRRSGEVIAEALGVPAAYITTGTSAGLALSAAACITKTDPEIIPRLPITEGLKNEIIVQKGHYPYNNMLRLPGAKLVYVGEETPKNNYPYPGGKEYPWDHKFNNQPEHIEEAINKNTCALYYVINGNLYEGSRDYEKEILIDWRVKFHYLKYPKLPRNTTFHLLLMLLTRFPQYLMLRN